MGIVWGCVSYLLQFTCFYILLFFSWGAIFNSLILIQDMYWWCFNIQMTEHIQKCACNNSFLQRKLWGPCQNMVGYIQDKFLWSSSVESKNQFCYNKTFKTASKTRILVRLSNHIKIWEMGLHIHNTISENQ